MTLDPEILARIQFGFTITFHIIFPTMTIGLSLFLVIVEGLYLRTQERLFLQLYQFWLNIFAMTFVVGVVTGIVMSFMFGLSFARFAQTAGSVIGPLIAMEVLTAFFLEAGFIGIVLFGLNKVGPKLHFVATCMVFLGTITSATWIVAANSWMQTPAGFAVQGGRLVVTNWWDVIINPSMLYRVPHTLMAAFLTGAFLVTGIGALYLLKGVHLAFARRTVSLGLAIATVCIGMQVFLGDLVYTVMIQHQPAKMQAAEGFWEIDSESPAPYYWFVIPDQKNQRNVFEIKTPVLGSIWLTHSLDGTVKGLKNTPRELQPKMAWVFYGFHLMYVIALIMSAVVGTSVYLRVRQRLFTSRWFLWVLVIMIPSGLLATLGGWYTAERGRQPFVIYGILKTADAFSPVPASTLLASLITFVVVYSMFLAAFLVFTVRIIRRGPEELPDSADVAVNRGQGWQSLPSNASPCAQPAE